MAGNNYTEHYQYRPVHREEDICPTCTSEREITMWDERNRSVLDVLWPCPFYMRAEYDYVTMLAKIADGAYSGVSGTQRAAALLNANEKQHEEVFTYEQILILVNLLNEFVSSMTESSQFIKLNARESITREDGDVWRWLTNETRSRIFVAIAAGS